MKYDKNNKKYRSKTEIIHDILETARNDDNGVVKTKLVRYAFLSSYQIGDYLSILIDNGLHRYDAGNKKFRITEKGLNLLQLCDQIGGLIEKRYSISRVVSENRL